ncbi:MAG: ATP-binding protein [Actinomycetota bacterium]|nr:ATP-binding protein [Actinomycetota bacterium]
MSRLPIRVRLTLAFALVMTVVLAAVGAFLHARTGAALAEQIDESLATRAVALTGLIRERTGHVRGEDLSGGEEEFAEVVEPDGSLIASSRSTARPAVSPREAARAASEAFFLRREAVAGIDDRPLRLRVAPVRVGERTVVLVVGASLEDRADALAGLRTQLLVVGPLALLLSSLAGYGLAAAALRPVDAMRRRAAEISAERPGERLPVPEGEDEVRRLGETLNAMLDRLEAGLARERRFVADASHELRTPLALLRAELELALRRPRSLAELEDALRSVSDEVERLARLAEDLLVLARADEGRLPLRREPVATGELLTTVAGRFAARAAGEGRAIVVSEGCEQVHGDRLRLEQAVGNLVDNALRHGTGTVRLDAERDDGLVALSVRDEGPGFPSEFLPRACERFARADDARTGGTAGLGLAIVDAIARGHGGAVRVANTPGGGAVVWMTVPAEGTPSGER